MMATKPDKPKGDGSELASMNVYQKMAVAQNLFQYVQKETRGGLGFAVVLHDAVAAKARAALLEARLYALPTVEEHGQENDRTWARVRMEYINIDNPDDRFSVTMFGYGIDRRDKGPGMAVSYATKYCYLKAFGVETGEDADMYSGETEAPKNGAPGAEPDDAEKDAINREDFFSQIKHVVEKEELNPDYVWAEMRRKAKGALPTTDELAHQAKHLTEHPDLWREPVEETAPVEA